MRINFDTEYQKGQLTAGDRIHTQGTSNRADKASDIMASGGIFTEGAYGQTPLINTDKAPVTDFMTDLGVSDVQLKTDYMSVMSLSMSDEDYAEMVRTGQMPEDMDVGDSVTILDDIKAAMIKGGADVAGYTDDIDADTLEEITGSRAAADALLKKVNAAGIDPTALAGTMRAQDLKPDSAKISGIADSVSLALEALPLSDSAAVYMVENGKSPTVENIYQAAGAGEGQSKGGRRYYSEDGYINMGAGEADIDALRPQIEDTIRKAGLEVNEEAYADAKLLIDHNVPLTPETLLELDSLKELRNGLSPDRIAASVSIAMSAGIPASKANLTYDASIYTEAEDILEDVGSISDEALDSVTGQGQILNIRNLKAAQAQIDAQKASPAAPMVIDTADMTADQIHSRRVLEEVRISMSVEANRMLLRGSFKIDIAPMEALVDALKEAEQAIADRLFPSEQKETSVSMLSTYTEVKGKLYDMPSMPAAILGQYRPDGILTFGVTRSYTLNEVYDTGSARRNAYIQAEETYEALMTAPRRDMGDSIRKAFANVDDILKDLQIDTSELNRRAVRILGYNSIEITPEKIEQVRDADINLRSVLDRLTPERVLNMIREDVNPLNMPIQELSEYLDGQDSDPERQAANYARFLMQLERHNEITELERDSYIGIYRMISRLDKTEDAAVGKLLAMGAEMSFANLLSAMRSTVKTGMDYYIGDEFGGVDIKETGTSIDEQINAAFTTDRFIRSARMDETVIENLISSGEGVSLTNTEAIDALKNRRGDWIKPFIKPIAPDGSIDTSNETNASAHPFEDAVTNVIEHLTGTDEALNTYTSMLEEYKSDIADMIYESNDIMDVRALRASMKQINVLNLLARDEVYDLPTDIDGEITSIRLTIRHESGAGRVAVSTQTAAFGVIAAEFSLRGSASGYIAYEKDDAYIRLTQLIDDITGELGFRPELVRSSDINLDKYTDDFFGSQKNKNTLKENPDSSDINNIELYRVARTFISALNQF